MLQDLEPLQLFCEASLRFNADLVFHLHTTSFHLIRARALKLLRNLGCARGCRVCRCCGRERFPRARPLFLQELLADFAQALGFRLLCRV